MKNEQVIINFLENLNGETPLRVIGFCKGRTLHTTKNVNGNLLLINYNTAIAVFDNKKNEVVLNSTKYSRTTSKIQNLIRFHCKEKGIKLIEKEAE